MRSWWEEGGKFAERGKLRANFRPWNELRNGRMVYGYKTAREKRWFD